VSSHRGSPSTRRTTICCTCGDLFARRDRWPTARLIHLPVHASWPHQIELYFSLLQRKARTRNALATLDALAERLNFGKQRRQIARPFESTFTRQKPNKVIDRIDRHEPQLGLAA
jgi:hypothetical protein